MKMKLGNTANPTPPVNEESDGDISAAESEHTNSTHVNEPPPELTENEEEAESDDSSDMDENECEIQRDECLNNLNDLEKQFNILREQLYRERIAQVEAQLAEVRSGKSELYLRPLQDLQKDMRLRVDVAGILRDLQLENIRHKFEAEEQAARQNFESEKALAWDYYYENLIETIQNLEEDRNNVEINWGEGGKWCSRSRSRSRRKAVTVSGPYIVYMLKPQDIMEDWTIIKKSLKG